MIIIKNPTKVKDTFDMAMERTGIDQQMDKCVEEMAELTQGIMKARSMGVAFSHNVFEEMAHVRLSLDLLEYWLPDNSDRISKIYNKRIDDWYEFERRLDPKAGDHS